MRSPGSPLAFMASMALALLLVTAGLVEIILPAGSTFFGVLLILAGFALSGRARNARAAHLHRQKMNGLWSWAQGLGPQGRRGGRRPW